MIGLWLALALAVVPSPPVFVLTDSSQTPTATSVAAAAATAQNNALCGDVIRPFYWEIGNKNESLAVGNFGNVNAATRMSIASASKWLYATYVTQIRGGALTAQDVNFLHFTSGYTNIGNSPTSECPNTLVPDTINQCLTQGSFAQKTDANAGRFDYDGGHMENHASQFTALGDVLVGQLGGKIGATLGVGALTYTEPLMAGGVYARPSEYTAVLRRIVSGALAMHEALGTNPVCTKRSASCNSVYSPIPEAWHYSIGHWVEDDTATKGDGAFSSPGAFGFYPWIDATKTYYGVIARQGAAGTGIQQGYASEQCGKLIRHAFMTGKEQTQPLPN